MANTAHSVIGYSIVGIGSFNPAILHPSWFELIGLFGKGESEKSEIEVCTPQVTIFESKDWLRVEAMPQRVSFRTSDATQLERLRDVFIGVFSVLTHTPVTAVGLNSHLAYMAASREEFHHIGHAIAPKAVWKGALGLPGVRSLVIEDPRLNKDFPGKLRVEVSARDNLTVGLDFNDHFDIEKKNAMAAIRIVGEKWLESTSKASSVADTVIHSALEMVLSDYEKELIAQSLAVERKSSGND